MGNCMGNRQSKTTSSNVNAHATEQKREPAPKAEPPSSVKQHGECTPVVLTTSQQTSSQPSSTLIDKVEPCLPSFDDYREDVQKLLFGQMGFVKSPTKPRIVRTFISAVAADSDVERNIFWNTIYPTLKSQCAEQGYEFLAIDPRNGGCDSIFRDKNTHDIYSSIIRECQAKSTGPSFLLFLNQKHDRCICPNQILSTAFERLQKNMKEDEKKLLNAYYYHDTNAIPPAYILQPVQQSHQDYYTWAVTKETICTIMRNSWGKEEKEFYMASDIEKEVGDGIFSPTSIKEGMIWVQRVLDDLDSTDDVAWKYLDLVGDAKESDGHSQEQLTQLSRRLAEQVIESHFIKLNVPWKAGGLDPEKYLEHKEYTEELRSRLLKQLTDEINGSIAENQRINDEMKVKKISDGLFEELQHHVIVAQNYCKHFVGQADLVEDMKSHLNSESNQVLLLHGPPGSGKSALVAKIAKVCQRSHVACVLRFGGSSPASSSLNRLLQSMCEQLAHLYQEHVSIAYQGPEQLSKLLSQLLNKVSMERPVLIIVDGLDWLDVDTSWIPTTLPTHVKLLLTCTSATKTYEKLKVHLGSQIKEVSIPGLSEKTTKKLTERCLQSKGRTLNDQQLTFLLNKVEKQPLPLFLHMVCHEASQWRSFTTDNDLKLQANMKAQADAMFDCLEKRYKRTVVSCAIANLCVARHGLSDVEMNDILSSDSTLLKELKAGHVSTLLWDTILLELQPFIQTSTHNGLCLRQLRYPLLLEVAKKRYLNTTDEINALHSNLHDYYSQQPDKHGKTPNIRRMQELPYHAFKCGKSNFSKAYIWNLEWLLTKLTNCGVYDVLDDVALALKSEPNDSDLKLFQDVLQISAYALVCDGLQIFPQIQQRLENTLNGKQNKYPHMTSLCNMASWPPLSNFVSSHRCLQQVNYLDCQDKSQNGQITSLFRIKGDDKHMISVSTSKGEVSVWNISTQKAVRTMTNVDQPRTVRCIDRYKVIILCNRVLKIYNLDTGELETTLKGTMNLTMPYFALHDDEHVVALSRNRMTVNIIQRSSGDVVATFKVGEDRFLNSLLVSENGERCVCGDETQKPSPLLVWDLNNRKLVHDLRIPQHEFITSMSSISNNGHYVVCVIKELGDASPNFVIVYDLQSGQLFKKWKPHCNSTAVYISAECGCVVNALEDGSLIVWDLSSGSTRNVLKGHTNPIDRIYLSQDGTRCLTFDSTQKDRTVRAWDLQTGERLASFTGDEPISCCQISADGTCAVISLPSQKSIVTLWIRTHASVEGRKDSCSYGDSSLNGKVYNLNEEI